MAGALASGTADDMSERTAFGRLLARLTGGWQLERLAALDEKVGRFGRAQREELASQRRQLEELRGAIEQRATARAMQEVQRGVEDIQRSLAVQDRTFSEALERAGRLDDQGIDDRRFARRMDQLRRSDRPIVVGPWTGEVGFELLYWIPFVRWVVATYGLSADRLIVVSRGGVESWYGGLASRYSDAFSFFSPDEFRAATIEAKKQRRVGAFDAELGTRVAAAHGLRRVEFLHPGLMYRLFFAFWKELATVARVEQYAAYARIDAPDDPVLQTLPKDYVAARFYFSDCFPDTPENRAFVSSTIDTISRQTPVVMLNTPFAVDDHQDFQPSGGRVTSLAAHMAPERNLAVQTAVIARSRAFVGTYGGYSYLAPFCGVSSLAFYSQRTFKAHHLHVAQHVFERLDGATIVPLDVAAAPLLRMALPGTVSVTS